MTAPPNISSYPWYTGFGTAGPVPACGGGRDNAAPPNVTYPWSPGLGGAAGGCPWGTLATQATAGIPGTWGPAGYNIVPDDAAMCTAKGVTASPGTNWTAGQYVACRNADAYWNGSAWVAGRHP